MREFALATLAVCLVTPCVAERLFDINGPVALHIWIVARSDQDEALEPMFAKAFYPAVRSIPGLRSALLMRKPVAPQFTMRLGLNSEE